MMRSSSGNGGQSTGSNRLAGPRQQLKRPSSASSSSSSLHHHQQQPPLLRPPPPAPPPPSSSSSFPVAFFSQLYYSKSNNSYYCFCMELWRSTEYLFENRLTWLVMFGPIAVVGDITGTLGEAVCFCLSGIALIPCAERLSFVTEQVAHHTNGTIGALLNATFGNAPELLISTAALSAGFYRVVQLAMLGSMLTNMMLVFGLSCFIGGLRWQVQSLRIVSGNVNVVMLWVATAGCLFPAMLLWSKQQNPVVTVIMTSTNDNNNSSSLAEQATSTTTTTTAVVPVPTREEIVLSRVNATVMLILYLSYLIFQMGTHKEEFDDNDNDDDRRDSDNDDSHKDHRQHCDMANANAAVVVHSNDHHVRQSARRNLVCFRWYQRARSSHWTIIPSLPSSRPQRRRRQAGRYNNNNNNGVGSRRRPREEQQSIHRPSKASPSSFAVPALARRNSEEFALLRHADTIGHRSLSMEESMSQLDDIDACILSLPQTESSTITHTNNTGHRSVDELQQGAEGQVEGGQQLPRSRCNSHGGEQSVDSNTAAADDAGWMSSSDENTTSRRRKPRRRQQQQQAKNLADSSSSSLGDIQMVQQRSSTTTTTRDPPAAFVLKRKNSCGNVVATDDNKHIRTNAHRHRHPQSPATAAAAAARHKNGTVTATASAAVASVASSLFLGDFAGLLLSNEKSKRSDGGTNDDDDDDNNRNNSYYPRDNHHHLVAGDYDDDDDQQQQLIDLEAITSSSGNSSSRSCLSSTLSSPSPSPSPPLPASKDPVANGAAPHFVPSTAAAAPAAAVSSSLQQPSGANGGVGSGNGGNGTAAVMSMRVGVIWLFIITLCISAMSDILVDTIDGFASRMRISQVFTSMIILPFFSNIAEQVSAFLFAYRNEMDLVVGVTVGSAIQIATFVIPGTVLIGMMMDRSMTLYFRPYETVSLFFGVICTGAILQGGTTNWLTGAMLVGIYVMFAAGVWFHEVEDLTVDAEIQIRNATSAAAAAAGGRL